MPYTRDWDTEVLGTPLGSRNSDEIDEAIREFKVDLSERLSSLVQDVNADPLTLALPGTGIDRSYAFQLPAAAGQIVSGLVFDPVLGAIKPTTAGGNGKWICAIPVIRTSHIIGVIVNCFRASPGSVTAKLMKINAASGATPSAPVAVDTDSAAGSLSVIQAIILGPFDEQIEPFNDLYIQVDITGSGSSADDTRLYSVTIAVKPDE